MKKKSKLREKGTRIPEIRETKWEQIVPKYLQEVQTLSTEPAKSHRFLLLLNELFGVQPGFIEEYVSGIEKYVKVKQKDRILRGQVDNLFGNLVIEFERDLAVSQREAEGQLKKYIACLWSQEPPHERRPYLCIAGDGVNLMVYSPTIEDADKKEVQPEEVRLELIEQVDWSVLKPQEVYFWLDRYFLRKEIRSPKTEEIVRDFGVKSHAFQVATQTLLSLWRRVESKSGFEVAHESWEKYLRIVYGTSVAEEELFIRHTYLATLAKLMAWSRLTEGTTSSDNAKILPVLEGQFFKEQGIENFLEEDFFSWIAREGAKDEGVETARMLLSLLRNYNLRELSEDVLKSLYQELVDPKTRHDLGEYYTPDWLAHRMVRRLIEKEPEGSFLDPACGSGTFLYFAVQEKRERLGDSGKTLDHILNSIAGVDIHPLAVIVAKTNYILALGDLLMRRRGKINIPIYLANTIRLPEPWMLTPGADYPVDLDGKTVYMPESLLDNPALYDEAIEAAKEFAGEHIGKQPTEEHFVNYLQAQHPTLLEDDAPIAKLFQISQVLRELIESGRDTIQAFVLKNTYKPMFLRGQFDFIMGNPPWLSYRYVEEAKYQAFLKEQIAHKEKGYGLLLGRAELITHLELGALFFVRTADLYLKERGVIGFVLPRSIFTADQHDGLRQGTFKRVSLTFREVWDLERVEPLFGVPACVLIAQKRRGARVSYPIAGQKISGELSRKNATLHEAQECLSIEDVEFSLNRVGKRSFWAEGKGITAERASYYKEHFRSGACIYPRALWFVEIKTSPLGFDPSLPPLETAQRARKQAKAAYKGLVLEGNVEIRFLYAALLAADLLPFGHLDYRLVVLPIEPSGDGYKLIASGEASKRGFLNLSRWLTKVQEEWEERRGEKAEGINAIEWLDYRRKLTTQNPWAKYRVLYNTSGTYVCACVAENRPIEFDIAGQKVMAGGVLADIESFYLETDDINEALYLSTALNAPFIDKLIKPMQARGLWGARHIHKKVLELPIPQFDPSKKEHLQLAELGKACSEKVAQWLASGGPGKTRSIGRLRGMVREMLQEELKEIDRLVTYILKGA